jgi:hypothetical protein
MPNHPIPVDKADEMKREYISYMTGLGVDMTHQTHSVSFGIDSILAWMTGKLPVADEFRIFFGRYPSDHVHAGRLTCIVWPYKDGKPSCCPVHMGKGGDPDDCDDEGEEEEPFNDGGLNP